MYAASVPGRYFVTIVTIEMTEPARVAVAPEDPAIAEINKRMEGAFEIFDHESNKTVDVR